MIRKRKNKNLRKNNFKANSKRRKPLPGKAYVKKRSEVYGILIVMISILFFISVFSPHKAGIVTGFLDNQSSFIFGLGKFLFPFLLLGWGISFFIKRINYISSRIGWGFFLLMVSVLGLLGQSYDYNAIFDEVLMKARGGIVGAGIYYGLLRLFTRAGSITILFVLLIISILIITKISIGEIFKRVLSGIVKLSRKFLGLIVMGIKRREDKDSIKNLESDLEKSIAERDAGKNNLKKQPEIYSEKSLEKKILTDIIYEEQKKDKLLEKQLEIPLYKSWEDDQDYKVPPESLLRKSKNLSPKLYKQNIKENVNVLSRLFDDFNLPARIVRVVRGPAVTLYELTLSPGVKVQKLLSLEDDFCVAMGSPDVRILTPIPGKSAIGIEVPNKIKGIVTLGDIYYSKDNNINENLLTVPLGKNLSGNIVYMDIRSMPHLLIAGATNSGKSSCLNSIITSFLMKTRPSQVKFILIDPKMVELSIYNGIPHLLTPVVINPKKSASILSWALGEMENRFKILVENNCKSIEIYNFEATRNKDKNLDMKPLPYIIIFIDELADLMMVSASEVEDYICRIAQIGRAVGIHLIIATQRPSVNIITGLIKANIPSRISFMVASNTDSRVILDCAGAEKLIGRGDMLYLPATSTRPERLQGAYVTTKEIEMITSYIKNQKSPDYNREILEKFEKKEKDLPEEDMLLYEALEIVVNFGHASTSLLQRKLRLGYSRAARIMDQLEERGFIGSYDGSKPREVFVSKDDLKKILDNIR